MDAFLRAVATFLRAYAVPLAIVMLALWAVATWFEGPGWVHLLLTLGVFLLIYGIVARGDPAAPDSAPDSTRRSSRRR
ncbi:MAG TPA: hypothetical protein VMM18_08055 [Gemmatimonadaceae bacterium]|nr:hypothetical protein [Gemmatimonadaceae bacterium]